MRRVIFIPFVLSRATAAFRSFTGTFFLRSNESRARECRRTHTRTHSSNPIPLYSPHGYSPDTRHADVHPVCLFFFSLFSSHAVYGKKPRRHDGFYVEGFTKNVCIIYAIRTPTTESSLDTLNALHRINKSVNMKCFRNDAKRNFPSRPRGNNNKKRSVAVQ